MVYQWKRPLYKVNAQTAGEHIEELCKEHGAVTAQLLLDDSRPEDAILHPCYEWDDAKAAEKYRLDQSKQIIGNLVTVVAQEIESEPEIQTIAFVNTVDRNKTAHYQSTMVALSEEQTKEQVLKNAKIELNMFVKKYENLLNVSQLLAEYAKKMSA